MPDLQRVKTDGFAAAIRRIPPASAFTLAALVQEALTGSKAGFDRVHRRFNFLFHELRSTAKNLGDALEAVSELNQFLFERKNFRSVKDSECGPHELLLGDVLEGHRGGSLPLAIVYREFLKRLGHSHAEFVNFPGFSYVKILYNHQMYFFDPSQNGRFQSVSDLQKNASDRMSKDVFMNTSFLETPSDVHVISRMLSKLKNIYYDRREWEKLLGVLDLLIELNPTKKSEFKERGLLLYQLGAKSDACLDLEFFLTMARPSVENSKLERILEQLKNPQVTPIY